MFLMPRTTVIRCYFVLSVIIVAVYCEGSGIWAGFNHEWLRKEIGLFETPHRLVAILHLTFTFTGLALFQVVGRALDFPIPW